MEQDLTGYAELIQLAVPIVNKNFENMTEVVKMLFEEYIVTEEWDKAADLLAEINKALEPMDRLMGKVKKGLLP